MNWQRRIKMHDEKLYLSINATGKTTGLSIYFIKQRLAQNKCPHIMSGNRCLINVPLFLQQLDEESKTQG